MSSVLLLIDEHFAANLCLSGSEIQSFQLKSWVGKEVQGSKDCKVDQQDIGDQGKEATKYNRMM